VKCGRAVLPLISAIHNGKLPSSVGSGQRKAMGDETEEIGERKKKAGARSAHSHFLKVSRDKKTGPEVVRWGVPRARLSPRLWHSDFSLFVASMWAGMVNVLRNN
jgi:hypothetical protein